MKSSASCAKHGKPLQPHAASRQRARTDAGRQADGRGPSIDDRSLSSNLPDLLPVLPGESDLVRIYFGDLIADMLKDSL